MRTAFMSQHGAATASATPVFVGEGMKIEPLVPTMASDMATLRANGVREVAALFGVPAAYLDASDARTQPEIAQQYVSACLEAWCCSWLSETTSKLARPGVRVGLDFSPVTQGDFRTAGRAYSQLVQVGCLAANDVRRRLGFPPVAGMDTPAPVISGVTPDPAAQDGQEDPNA
jgi:HK97 family phage portal protein